MKTKLTALLLALITVLTISAPAFAADEFGRESETYSDQTVVTEQQTEANIEEDISYITDSDDVVAYMYICATAKSLTGHVWLYFENVSDHDINVGYVTLGAGETTSVGSLRNSRTDGGGTYYNGEAYMANGKSSVTNATISLKEELTEAELEKVSDAIESKNSYNIFFNNCGNFATSVWNKVSDKKMFHACFPIITIMEMIAYGGIFGRVDMNSPDIADCYKQVSGGVKEAEASSFNLSCV